MDAPNRRDVPPDGSSLIAPPRTQASLSTRGAMLTIIKCAIGAGSFSLPRAFMDGGVYISFLTTIFLGILSGYTLLLLVDSSTISSLLTQCSIENKKDNSIELSAITNQTRPTFLSFNYKPLEERSRIEPIIAPEVSNKIHCSTYPEMGAVAFPEVTFTFRGSKYNLAYIIITVGILLTSLGVCAAYVDFIAGTLPEVVRGWSQNKNIFLTIDNTPWIIMPIILGFSFLRTMKVLTYTSFFGNLLVLIGCFVVLVLGIIHYHKSVTMDHNFVEWQTLPRYVGGNTFLFAIHVVILPLMQQMENQNGNKNKRDAISGSYIFITTFNAIFGSVGFLLFASSTCTNDQATPYAGPCDNILSSISGGSLLDFVKILVSIDLLFTIPLILAASRAVIEDGILNSTLIRDGRRKWLNRYRKKCERENNSDGHELNATGFNHQLHGSKSPLAKRVSCAFDADASVELGSRSHDGQNSVDTSTVEERKEDQNSDEDIFTVIDFNTVADNPIHRERTDIDDTEYDSDNLDRGIKMAQEILLRNERFTLIVQYSVRTSLVISVILMAVLIPNFGDMVDLVGGVVCSFTGFFLPPVIYMRLRSKLFHLQVPMEKSTTITNLTHSLQKKKKAEPLALSGDDANATSSSAAPDTPGPASGEGATYVEKQPMSITFLILHFLIMVFGLVTMVTTAIVTIVNINGRDAAEAAA
jgi:amino acid permease